MTWLYNEEQQLNNRPLHQPLLWISFACSFLIVSVLPAGYKSCFIYLLFDQWGIPNKYLLNAMAVWVFYSHFYLQIFYYFKLMHSAANTFKIRCRLIVLSVSKVLNRLQYHNRPYHYSF